MSKKIMGVTVGTPIRPSKFASELADRVEEMVKANTEQEKTVDITENGTLEIVPDEGYKLTKVTANVNVPTASGDNKLPQLADGTLTDITAEDLEGATKIKRYCFIDVNIESITMPNSITSIGDYAFQQVKTLTTAIFSSNITEIGENVFQETNLEEAILPNGLTILKKSIFDKCHKLVNVILPQNLVEIKDYVFRYCSGLTSLTIPATVSKIGISALQCGSTSNKTTFTFLGTTPPTISSATFSTSYLNKIIVPAGSGEAYRTATNWANFADYIEEAAV